MDAARLCGGNAPISVTVRAKPAPERWSSKTHSRQRSRRGSCDWTVGHAGWLVTLLLTEEETFYGRPLEEALARCLEWLMRPEIRGGPLMVRDAEV
jgi:hypothetical protein